VRKENCSDGDVGKKVGGTRTVDMESIISRTCMIRAGRERSESITTIIIIPRARSGLYH
jgi:hypothetical protein